MPIKTNGIVLIYTSEKQKIQTRYGNFEKANARTLPKCPRNITGFNGNGLSKSYR
jgi:hypothetical protein